MTFKSPSITVDGIIMKDNKIILIKRGNDPFKGKYALPGGFVDYGERVEDAIIREIDKTITGIQPTVTKDQPRTSPDEKW